MNNRKSMARFVPRPSGARKWPGVAFAIALLIIPLAISLTWGTCFDDDAYATLRRARSLVTGREVNGDLVDRDGESQPRGTLLRIFKSDLGLYTLTCALLARWPSLLPQAALVLSAFGWGGAALALYYAGRAMRRPVAAIVASMLTALCPLVASTPGTELSWVMALVWMAVGASIKKQWHVQIGMLALLLWTRFDASTLAITTWLLAITTWMLAVQRTGRKPLPSWPNRISILVLFLGWLATAWQLVTQFSLQYGWGSTPGFTASAWLAASHSSLLEWGHVIRQLADESEFYWLFVPFIGMGLFVLSGPSLRKLLWAGLPAAVVLLLAKDAAAEGMMMTLGLFLTGLGVDETIGKIEKRGVRGGRLALIAGVVLIVGVPLGMAPLSSLVQRYRSRPLVRCALERQAADWLHAHSEATAALLASERVGYLADRATTAWDGTESEPAKIAALLDKVADDPPDYGVSVKSLAWDRFRQSGWFQDEYVLVREFESPNDAISPLAIWRRRPRTFDLGDHRPLNVRFHNSWNSSPGVYCLGFKIWPERIQPGESVYITLFLQTMASERFDATTATSIRPLVRMHAPRYGDGWTQIAPTEGFGWMRHAALVSSDTLADSARTGQVIAAQFELTQTADISIGAYYLDLSAAASGSGQTPAIYRDQDAFPLDRVVLGAVVVPWPASAQQMATYGGKPAVAHFGDEIDLLAYEVADSLPSGTPLDVTLYWNAKQSPRDDYVVFVHVLDIDGQQVAGHNAPPLDGRYPTGTWLPGEIVPDTHRIVFDQPVSAGTVQLSVGMYRWPSMERLPVSDAQGTALPNGILPLSSVRIQ